MTRRRRGSWGGQAVSGYRFRPKTFLMTDNQIKEIRDKLDRMKALQAELDQLDALPLEEMSDDDNRLPDD